MDRDRHARLVALFDAALQLREPARTSWLEIACEGDDQMRAELRALLSNALGAGEFLEQPAALELGSGSVQGLISSSSSGASTASPAVDRIGRFTVLETLGEGGMGVVYLARRDEDGGALVAIKLMRNTVSTSGERARFERERRLLNALSHPNIARLIDIGTTESEHPFFVMEYVRGLPIDRYCDENRLSTEARLKLFRKVCDAVQYVHQNLIIHRDIKPGNILVTPDGEPKLLDFGISKLANPALEPTIEVTRRGFRLLTPRYASPEQIREQPLSTATDIYSLGVLLYELLTGHWPYQIKTTEVREIEHAICDLEPERPSTAVNRTAFLASDGKTHPIDPQFLSRARDGAPNRLRGKLRGDLDNVLLKALDKAPSKRYESASQFSDDIRRHLANETVIARPPSIRYQLAKFIRRRRGVVAAGAAVFLTLTAGILFTTRAWNAEAVERRRAEAGEAAALEAQAKAEQAQGKVWHLSLRLVTDLPQQFIPMAGTVAVRRAMAEAAMPYLEELAAAAPTDPKRRLGVAQALDQLARSQADPRSGNVGDIAGALPLQSRALTMRREVLSQDPQNAVYQILVADSGIRVADLRRYSGECHLAMAQYEEAISILTPLIDGERAADARVRLAGALAAMGECQLTEGHLARARELYERAQEIRRRQAAEVKDDNSRRNLSVGQLDLANVLLLQGARAEAIELIRQAVSIRRELLERQPTQARTRRDLALSLIDLAQAEEADGQIESARRSAREALAILDPLIESEMDFPDVRHRQTWCRAALVLLQANATTTSEERSILLDRARATADDLARDAPDVAENRRLQARALLMTGAAELEAGRSSDALLTLAEAAGAADSLLGLVEATFADHVLQGDIRAMLGRAQESRALDTGLDATTRNAALRETISAYESSLRSYAAAENSPAAESAAQEVRAILNRLTSRRP